jgi:hypothetical protein
MPHENPIQDALQAMGADEETAAIAGEDFDERLQDEFDIEVDKLAELDDLLREYADELREVHEEYRAELAERGLAEYIGIDPEADVPGPEYPPDGEGSFQPPTEESTPAESVGGIGGEDPVSRLRELDALVEDGIITESEFEETKANILEDL